MKGKFFTAAAASALLIGLAMAGPAHAGKFSASTGPSGTQVMSDSLNTAAVTQVGLAEIKMPNKKDLLIGFSLETALTTRTLVRSKGGKEADTQSVLAGVAVWVEVDGQIVAPGKVIYDQRMQELTALLGDTIDSCTDANLDGTITVADECTVTEAELELLLRSAGANHFNWIAPDLEPGYHTIAVYAELTTNDDVDNDTVPNEAVALFGKRTLSVEEVQAVNDGSGIIDF